MASADLFLQPGLQLPARLDFVQDAIRQRKIAIPLRLNCDPDFNLRLHAGERLRESVNLVRKILDFRHAQNGQGRSTPARWRLDRRRLRRLRRGAANSQFGCAVMLQRTDRAAAARAMDEPLAQGGIEAVEESLRRPRPATLGLQDRKST